MRNAAGDKSRLSEHNVIVLEQDDDGKFVSVAADDLPDFTQPPEGMPRAARRRWKRSFDDLARRGMPVDIAWAQAMRTAIA